jgi:hypothetical protein
LCEDFSKESWEEMACVVLSGVVGSFEGRELFIMKNEEFKKLAQPILSFIRQEKEKSFEDAIIYAGYQLFGAGNVDEIPTNDAVKNAKIALAKAKAEEGIKCFEHQKATEERVKKERWIGKCSGCSDGHPSFWKTIVESKEWKDWEKEQIENPQFDIDESRVCGWLGEKHRNAFFNFICKSAEERVKREIIEKIKEMWNYPCNCSRRQELCNHNYDLMESIINSIKE